MITKWLNAFNWKFYLIRNISLRREFRPPHFASNGIIGIGNLFSCNKGPLPLVFLITHCLCMFTFHGYSTKTPISKWLLESFQSLVIYKIVQLLIFSHSMASIFNLPSPCLLTICPSHPMSLCNLPQFPPTFGSSTNVHMSPTSNSWIHIINS